MLISESLRVNMDSRMETGSLYGSSSPQDFVFTASDDLLTCSKKVDVKVSFVFVVWKEPCK
jgi:hypothetical protein